MQSHMNQGQSVHAYLYLYNYQSNCWFQILTIYKSKFYRTVINKGKNTE